MTPPSPCPSNAEHLSVLEPLQDKWFCFDEIGSRALPLSPSPPTQAAALGGEVGAGILLWGSDPIPGQGRNNPG